VYLRVSNNAGLAESPTNVQPIISENYCNFVINLKISKIE